MTIMFRSALISFGKNPPPELAYITRRHTGEPWTVVTFAEVAEEKRRRQRVRFAHKRDPGPQRRAWMVRVFYNKTFIYGGWHCYLARYDQATWQWNPSRQLMRMFPLVLPIGSVEDQWAQWKIEFARQYKRRTHHGKPEGIAYVWGRGKYDELERAK